MNDPKSQSTGGAMDAGAMQARLDRIRLGVTAHQGRVARGSFITAIVGVIVCGWIAISFGVLYKWATELLTPKSLAANVEYMIVEGLPDLRKKLEPEIEKNAPDWARDLSQALQSQTPELRARLEDIIMEQVEEGLKTLQGFSAERFRGFVAQNRVDLADGFNSFQEPAKAKRFIADLHVAVEKSLGRDMEEQAEGMLHTFVDLNRKVKKLSKGEGLRNDEEVMREILMTAKRLQEESSRDPSEKKKAKASAPESESTEETAPKPEGEKDKPQKEPEPEKKSGDN